MYTRAVHILNIHILFSFFRCHLSFGPHKKRKDSDQQRWRVKRKRKTTHRNLTNDSVCGTSVRPLWTDGLPCPCCRGWWPKFGGRAKKTTLVPFRLGKFSLCSYLHSSDASLPITPTHLFSYLNTKHSSFRDLFTTAMISLTLLILSGGNKTTPNPRCRVTSSRLVTPTR